MPGDCPAEHSERDLPLLTAITPVTITLLAKMRGGERNERGNARNLGDVREIVELRN